MKGLSSTNLVASFYLLSQGNLATRKVRPVISSPMYGSCTFRAERGMSTFRGKRGMRNFFEEHFPLSDIQGQIATNIIIFQLMEATIQYLQDLVTTHCWYDIKV